MESLEQEARWDFAAGLQGSTETKTSHQVIHQSSESSLLDIFAGPLIWISL